MHRTRFIFGISVLFLAAGIVVTAQQGNGGAPKTTHPTTTAKPTVAKPTTPKVAPAPQAAKGPQAAAAHATVKTQPKTTTTASTAKPQAKPGKSDTAGVKTDAKSPAAKTAKNDKTAAPTKTDGKPAKSDKSTDTKVAKADKKTSDKSVKTATTSTGTTTTTTTTLTPVQQKLKQNTNLAAKLESQLPKGTDLMAASAGFKNLGQFVAAVNVSNNLGLSFDDLKMKIVTDNMSLGQAIQAVRPLTASPTIEAQRAEYDARGMIAESEQAESSATSKTKSGPVTTATSSPTSSTTVKTKAKPKASAQ
jgi:hypothetical protein